MINIKKSLMFGISAMLLAGCATAVTRTKIGQHAYVKVNELNTSYLSRIDTGARITSLHALNIKLLDNNGNVINVTEDTNSEIKNKSYKDNIGKLISFDTINEKGEKTHYKTKVKDVALVKNAQGREYRYVIDLTLTFKGNSKHVNVNLRDRSKMEYKLLIGRNWLHNDFYVVTDLKDAK
ncbi:Protein of unknown function DUF785 [hydrothermal vent metagenome]|uniref:Retropepsin-like aspartic endopeptidase domain-containing protein n=1 Tax=hydrothermal vent metagenome TaxID=652676 RepID=A0A1W1EDY3_9ZZZZ